MHDAPGFFQWPERWLGVRPEAVRGEEASYAKRMTAPIAVVLAIPAEVKPARHAER
jgi:hypothetical protein